LADEIESHLRMQVRPYLYIPFWQFLPMELPLAVRSAADPAGLGAAIDLTPLLATLL
jgi:hypothetical protein